MSSSTSSFRNELKVLAVVLAVVGALEAWQRMRYVHRPFEAAMLRNFPALADRLSDRRYTGLVLLGNSLTQNGYNLPLLRQTLEEAGNGDLHVESIALSGSNPIEWYHNLAVNFMRRGKTPDVVVINMSPSGISDELPAGYRIGWLAHETDWRDVPEVLFDDLNNTEVGGQYLQARVSMLYANRWDIRVELLNNLIPAAKAGMQWVNSGQPAPKARPGDVPPRKTYSLLARLLDLARSNGAHVVLVAMPAREGYTIDPGLPGILKEYGVTFLDCRMVPGLTEEGFEDGWHLNPSGAKVFTPYIAEQLAAAAKGFVVRKEK